MKKTPDTISKQRQSLTLQRDKWVEKAEELEIKLAEKPRQRKEVVRQIEYARDEASKLEQALQDLSTLTPSQKLAGWGESRKKK